MPVLPTPARTGSRLGSVARGAGVAIAAAVLSVGLLSGCTGDAQRTQYNDSESPVPAGGTPTPSTTATPTPTPTDTVMPTGTATPTVTPTP